METLKDFCTKHGISENVELDGQIHNIKEKNFKGWYIGSKELKDSLKITTFTLHNWKTNERYFFKESPENLTEEQAKEFDKTLKENKTAQEKQIKAEEERIAIQAEDTFSRFPRSPIPHPYLIKKKLIGDANIRIINNSFGLPVMHVPMKDSRGKLWGYQTIDENGEKSFIPGQRIDGLFFQFGKFNADIIFVCEGYATGESIYQATDKCVVVAFSASNLKAVGKALRDMLPEKKIVFCADNDQYGERNFGVELAKQAATESKAQVIIPDFPDKKTNPTDYNDLHCIEGLGTVKNQIFANDFVAPHRIIPTENSGFHHVELKNGKEVHIPCVGDLRDFFERKHRYVVHEQSEVLYVFNGKYYESVGNKFIECFAETHFDPKPNLRLVKEFMGKILRTNVVKETWFTQTVFKKVNFCNGILDLKTKTLSTHSSEIGFKYVLPYNYDKEAEAPIFENFMFQLTMDKELAKLMFEYFGYALSNDPCWAQKVLVLVGEGANGKSTLLDIFKSVIGEKNYSPLNTGELNSERNRVLLEGKLANIAEETPNKTIFDSSVFKNLATGGEVQARHMYKPPYVFKNRAKLILSCNDLQETTDLSYGFFRRFLIVRFNNQFTKEKGNVDHFIKDKLMGELSGIFNLCMKAYEEMKERTYFTETEDTKKEVEDYIKQNDPLTEWLEDHLLVHHVGNGADELRVSLSTIYQEYSLFLETHGFRKITHTKFGKKLKVKIPEYDKRITIAKDKERKSVRQLKAVVYNQ